MIQKKSLLGLLLLPSLLLSSCSFDLGTFEKNDSYKSYYEAFADVRAKYDGGSALGLEDAYNVKKSLFNDYTVNELDWEKSEDKVKERQYVYLIVTFKEVLKVESLAMYFKSSKSCKLTLNAFYFVSDDLAPQNIMYLSSPSATKEDEPIIYDDPDERDANVSLNLGLKSNEWESFTFSKFKQVGYSDGLLHTGTNSVLYIRIENNSGHNRSLMTPASFTFINLLVRAVE